MKKQIFVIALALVLTASFAWGQGLGLSAGLEIQAPGLNVDGNMPDAMVFDPMVRFENNELVENLDLYIGLDIPIMPLTGGDMMVGLDLEFDIGYNIVFGASKLTISLDNQIGIMLTKDAGSPSTLDYGFGAMMSGPSGGGGGMSFEEYKKSIIASLGQAAWDLVGDAGYRVIYDGIYGGSGGGGGGGGGGDTITYGLMPRVKFTQTLDFGDLYFQVAMPFWVAGMGDPFDSAGLVFTLGAQTAFGLGVWADIYNFIRPDADFFQFVNVGFDYDADPLYAKLEVGIPTMKDGFDNVGLSVTPHIAYKIMPALKAYLEVPVAGLGVTDGLSLGVNLGVLFSF